MHARGSSTAQFDYRTFRAQWEEHMSREEYLECEEICLAALQQNPSNKHRSKLYNHLGFIYENYLDDKTFDDILEHYVLALQVDESNASAHYNLSNFLLEQGMQHLLRALELKPSHAKAKQKLALLQPIKTGDLMQLKPLAAQSEERSYLCEEISADGINCTEVVLNADGSFTRRLPQTGVGKAQAKEEASGGVLMRLLGAGLPKPVHELLSDLKQQFGISPMTVDSTAVKPLAAASAVEGNATGAGVREAYATGRSGGERTRVVVQSETPNGCCVGCKWCVPLNYNWCLWLLLSILTFGSLAAFTYGYMSDKDCSDKWRANVKTESLTASASSSSPLHLDVLLVGDCSDGSGDLLWSQQLSAMDSLLSAMDADSRVQLSVALAQGCGDVAGAGMGAVVTDDAWDAFDSTDVFNQSALTNSSSAVGGQLLLAPVLSACYDAHTARVADLAATEPQHTFLCVPFMTTTPSDMAAAITATRHSMAEDTYSIYMLMSENSDVMDDDLLYYLGTLGMTVDQCSINGSINSWWATDFVKDCTIEGGMNDKSEQCPHCLIYDEDFECQANNTLNALKEGVYAERNQMEEKEKCKMKVIYYYALAGVIPLLLFSLVALVNSCCVTCCVSDSDDSMQSRNAFHL